VSLPDPSQIVADAIPPADQVRRRLAANYTEADLLRRLLKLAVRREQEAERLVRANPQQEGADYAAQTRR
jgi:hypothetical protein